MRYFDAHAHILAADERLGAWLEQCGLGMLHCGLTPRSWEADRRMERIPGVLVGAGLHPWWVHCDRPGSARCEEPEAQLMERLCWESRFIGEVGLDFGRKTQERARAYQLDYFTRVCREAAAAARETGVRRILSIHSVNAAGAVLDVLERTGASESCDCVFHWFTGSGEELRRAIRSGCWFSVNAMGLSTGKGREYAKLVPGSRLLTESDLLETAERFAVIGREVEALERAVGLIAQARMVEPEAIRELCLGNARALFFE